MRLYPIRTSRGTLLIILIALGMLLGLTSSTQAQSLVVTVGDTVGPPGQLNSVVTVYMLNYDDDVAAFEVLLYLPSNEIAEFQTELDTVIDTTWWVCKSYDGPVCEDSFANDDSVVYWVCDSTFMSECVDSHQVNFFDNWEWKVTYDFSHVDTTEVFKGSIDTVGTAMGGWEFMRAQSWSGTPRDIKVTAVADVLNNTQQTPPIHPQTQAQVLFRLLADIQDIEDTITAREAPINIETTFLQQFSFSRPDGSSIGIVTTYTPDSNFYHCEQWLPDTTCGLWQQVGSDDDWDSLYIGVDTSAYLDTNVVIIENGSITALIGCCTGRTGDVDVSQNEPFEVDSSDLGALVSYLFAPPGTVQLPCEEEADVNAQGGAFPVDSSDLGALVNYLFSPPGTVTLPACP